MFAQVGLRLENQLVAGDVKISILVEAICWLGLREKKKLKHSRKTSVDRRFAVTGFIFDHLVAPHEWLTLEMKKEFVFCLFQSFGTRSGLCDLQVRARAKLGQRLRGIILVDRRRRLFALNQTVRRPLE